MNHLRWFHIVLILLITEAQEIYVGEERAQAIIYVENLKRNYEDGLFTVLDFFHNLNSTLAALSARMTAMDNRMSTLTQLLSDQAGKIKGLEMKTKGLTPQVISTPGTGNIKNATSTCKLSDAEMADLIQVGFKVVRGKDWEWGDQDGDPPAEGEVIEVKGGGWLRVRWKNSKVANIYRMGANGKFDLKLVDDGGSFKIGSAVVRGSDWIWSDQDGEPPGQGWITEIKKTGWVIVRWDHGDLDSYRMGYQGKYDLKLVPCL